MNNSECDEGLYPFTYILLILMTDASSFTSMLKLMAETQKPPTFLGKLCRSRKQPSAGMIHVAVVMWRDLVRNGMLMCFKRVVPGRGPRAWWDCGRTMQDYY